MLFTSSYLGAFLWLERSTGRTGSRRLKLRDLHVYFTVVQCGSMAKAAAELGVAQPTVSENIDDLEHTFGVRLLDRGARGVEPTMYGTALSSAALRRSTNSSRARETSRSWPIRRRRTPDRMRGIRSQPRCCRKSGRINQQFPGIVLHIDDMPSTALSVLRARNTISSWCARSCQPAMKQTSISRLCSMTRWWWQPTPAIDWPGAARWPRRAY